MNRLMEDLRFFIGAFFALVGVILVVEGIRSGVLVEGYNLNLITGMVFTFFGGAALYLSICQK